MDPHYHISENELESHPSMRLLRDGNALTIYESAFKYGRDFLCNTSGWTTTHLQALKVFEFRDLPIHRLCPASYAIPSDSALAQQVRNAFALSPEAVKAGQHDMMSITSWFYSGLSILLRTDRKTSSPGVKDTAPKRLLAPVTFLSPHNEDPDNTLGTSFTSTSDGSSYSPMASPQCKCIDNGNDVREVATNNMVGAFISILSNLPTRKETPQNYVLNSMHCLIASISHFTGLS
jgi:hypothetical protein